MECSRVHSNYCFFFPPSFQKKGSKIDCDCTGFFPQFFPVKIAMSGHEQPHEKMGKNTEMFLFFLTHRPRQQKPRAKAINIVTPSGKEFKMETIKISYYPEKEIYIRISLSSRNKETLRGVRFLDV